MFPSERRTTHRRKLHLELCFHRQNAPAEDEHGVTSVNVPTSGVYFVSSFPLLAGDKIEVSMKMPTSHLIYPVTELHTTNQSTFRTSIPVP